MHDRLYRGFYRLRDRCYNPYSANYRRYGGKGITICREWMEDPERFISWALENGYRPYLHLHRKDNDVGYSPDNCEFLTSRDHRRLHGREQRIKLVNEPFNTREEDKCL